MSTPAPQPENSTPSSSAHPRSAKGRSLLKRTLHSRHGAVLLLVLISMGISLAMRLALTFKAGANVSWDLPLLAAFAWGALFDLATALWWAGPLAVTLAVLPERFFENRIVRGLAHAVFVGAIFALLFGAVSEWVFWDEFGVRFNFIAVDYLVYTTEVVGNIRESYPMPLIVGGLLGAACLVHVSICRAGLMRNWMDAATEQAGARWKKAGVWVLATAIVGVGLSEGTLPNFKNNYTRELGKSGLWSLFAAFRANQLDYDQFYPTMPDDKAFARVHALLARDGSERLNPDPTDLLRVVRNPGPERRLNVIQVTIESLSAEFLARHGNTQGLMPNLDALAAKSLVFDSFYATGTRTDRGMEALTLSVPPTPGRSLVKRLDNANLFTLGSIFRSKGYETSFIYSGFGYFDNMNTFFGGNGYRVVDRTMVAKTDITFANVWGVCDEDLYRWTLREADRDYAAGKPFFYFVMTTSNHRPFTFPDGKIDLPSKISGREGAVKYTDFAIGELLREASTKPWYKDTLFVFVGDHCASSAGKAELPVDKYHIPMFIYTPGGQVPPGVVKTLSSQMDYAPTLLGLMQWTYPSRFFGADVLRPGAALEPRALIGNYQKLGLLRGGELAVLKPVRQSATYRYDEATKATTQAPENQALIDDAIAYYQTASHLFKSGKQGEHTSIGP